MAQDKPVAVVTGANRGLGFEACRQLAQQGFCTALAARDAQKGITAAQTLQKEGLDVRPYALDVTDATQVSEFAAALERDLGRVDVLINNAGIFPDDSGPSGTGASVLETDPNLVAQAIDVNLIGALRVTQAVVPMMLQRRFGRIVNVSSGMGQLSDMEGQFPGYRTSKTALNALTRILAAELGDTGVKVNSVCPGWVRTDMGGPDADRSPAEGVDTFVWLATLPDDGPSGGFFRDRAPIPW